MEKVCHIAPEFRPIPTLGSGGVEQVIEDFARYGEAYEHHIVCPSHPERPGEEIVDGIHYHRIHISQLYTRLFKKWTRLDPRPYAKRVAEVIDRLRPQYLHFHNRPKLCRDLLPHTQGAKTLFHIHNLLHDPIPDVDMLVGCSEFIVNEAVERDSWKKPSGVMYNGVDTQAFSDKQIFQWDDLDFSGKRVIGCVTRMSEEKGVDFLVNTFVDQMQSLDDVCLVIAGEIRRDKNKGESRTQYASQVTGKADGRVYFLDAVPFDRIKSFYQLCELYIQPSRHEALGLSLLEAMASSRPVIISKVGGMPEVVNGSQCGRVVNFGDQQALSETVANLLDDDELRSSLARGARARSEVFDISRVVHDNEKLYEQIR